MWVAFGGRGSGMEGGLLVHECAGHVEIVGDIGPVVNEATGLDDAGEEFGEGGVKDASLVVSGFPPGVREVDMSGVNGGRGDGL